MADAKKKMHWKFDFRERNVKDFADIYGGLDEFSYFEGRTRIFAKVHWSSNTNGYLIITIRAEDYPGRSQADMAPLHDFLLDEFDKEVQQRRACGGVSTAAVNGKTQFPGMRKTQKTFFPPVFSRREFCTTIAC